MRVRDVMPPELVCVRPDDSIRMAADKLVEYEHRALPVVNDENRLVGIISEVDLLALLLPDYVAQIDDLSFLPGNFAPGRHTFENVLCLPVSKAMRTDIDQVTTEDEPVLEVIRQMLKYHIRHIPVLRDGKLVGMLSSGSLVRSLIRETGECP
jgi:CBS domain-containing protein